MSLIELRKVEYVNSLKWFETQQINVVKLIVVTDLFDET